MTSSKRPRWLDALVIGSALLLAAISTGYWVSRSARKTPTSPRTPTPPVLITYQPQSLAVPAALPPLTPSGTKSAATHVPSSKETQLEKPRAVRLSVPPPDK